MLSTSRSNLIWRRRTRKFEPRSSTRHRKSALSWSVRHVTVLSPSRRHCVSCHVLMLKWLFRMECTNAFCVHAAVLRVRATGGTKTSTLDLQSLCKLTGSTVNLAVITSNCVLCTLSWQVGDGFSWRLPRRTNGQVAWQVVSLSMPHNYELHQVLSKSMSCLSFCSVQFNGHVWFVCVAGFESGSGHCRAEASHVWLRVARNSSPRQVAKLMLTPNLQTRHSLL